MNVWIVVEGKSELAIIESLLPSEIQSVSVLYATGERSNIVSIARTLLVKHREPVVVLMDTHTLDPTTIQEQYVDADFLMRAVAGGTPFKVVLSIPAIEAVFFNVPEILKRIYPQVNFEGYRRFFTTQPKEFLTFLFEQGGGPTNLALLLDNLTEDDTKQLCETYPINQLTTFVHEVVDPVAR